MILVTGAHGLVGRSLQELLGYNYVDKYMDYYFLTSTECDLRNTTETDLLFKRIRPHTVVHLAAKVGGVYDNINNNYEFLNENISINMNVVNCCKKYRVKKLINILSTCIFPDKNIKYPLTSDQLHNGLPHNSNIGYAFSKRLLQVASSLLSETHVINLIPTNLYGKFDNYNLESSHVIPALVHKVYLSKYIGKQLILNGSGSARRQFLYVDDLSRVILHFIYESIEPVNLSIIVAPPQSQECSIKDVLDTIKYEFNWVGTVIYDSTYSDGQLVKTVDSSEINIYIPDFRFTDLKRGLSQVISFFHNNYNTDVIRK